MVLKIGLQHILESVFKAFGHLCASAAVTPLLLRSWQALVPGHAARFAAAANTRNVVTTMVIVNIDTGAQGPAARVSARLRRAHLQTVQDEFLQYRLLKEKP